MRVSVGAIHAGTLPIVLEHTTLATVRQHFGGRLQRGGDAAGAVSWLCYRAAPAGSAPVLYWFDSNEEMSSQDHSISEIAVQAGPPAAVLASCGPAPDALTGITSTGLPGVGDTEATLQTRLGENKTDAKGFVVYNHERTLRDKSTTEQTVTYQVENGRIKLMAIAQVTSN